MDLDKFLLVFYLTSSHLWLLCRGVKRSASPDQHMDFCSNASVSYVNGNEMETKYGAVLS